MNKNLYNKTTFLWDKIWNKNNSDGVLLTSTKNSMPTVVRCRILNWNWMFGANGCFVESSQYTCVSNSLKPVFNSALLCLVQQYINTPHSSRCVRVWVYWNSLLFCAAVNGFVQFIQLLTPSACDFSEMPFDLSDFVFSGVSVYFYLDKWIYFT